MARVKGGLNAKKKHNRVLKLAKGYRVQTAVDRSYQRSSTYQWSVLQQVHVRLKAGWC